MGQLLLVCRPRHVSCGQGLEGLLSNLRPGTPTKFMGMVYPANYTGDPKAHPTTTSHRIGRHPWVEFLQPIDGKIAWRDSLDSTEGVGGLHYLAFSARSIDGHLVFLKNKGGVIEFGGNTNVIRQHLTYVNIQPTLELTIQLNEPPKP
jgi:hypothetical protein